MAQLSGGTRTVETKPLAQVSGFVVSSIVVSVIFVSGIAAPRRVKRRQVFPIRDPVHVGPLVVQENRGNETPAVAGIPESGVELFGGWGCPVG
ncbi:MAG: hypothetical protein M3017_00995, partial [Actinomycetota bacterium]|nr:hypothetical protein [Actinomycetota bacterium]